MLVIECKKVKFLSILIVSGFILLSTVVLADPKIIPDMRNDEPLSDLRSLLHTEKEWIKVHVAEFLIWENEYTDEVKNVFLEEERQFRNTPKYRIGIWRVLAQVAQTKQERWKWENKIVEVYSNPTSPDRPHAIETLAKLKHAAPGISPDWVRQIKDSVIDPFAIYRLWNAAYNQEVGMDSVRATCISLLATSIREERDELIPVISYVFRYLKPFEIADWDKIKTVAMGFQGDESVYANLLATAWLTVPDSAVGELQPIKNRLTVFLDEKIHLLQVFSAFAEKGGANELNQLIRIYTEISDRNLQEYDADVHAMAAYAIVKIKGRLIND